MGIYVHLKLHVDPFSAVYDLLVDELGADHTLLNIRGETVGAGCLIPLLTLRAAKPFQARK